MGLVLIYLETLQADVVCLQEVTLMTFEVNFVEMYDYVIHKQDKRRTTILFRKKRFELRECYPRTKAIHCALFDTLTK